MPTAAKVPPTQRPVRLKVARAAIDVAAAATWGSRPPGQVSLVSAARRVCLHCGLPFNGDQVVVVDERELPALFGQARDGSVPVSHCPAGHRQAPDSHSILLRDRSGRLLLRPGATLSQRGWYDAAAALLGALPARLRVDDVLTVEVLRSRPQGMEDVQTLPAVAEGDALTGAVTAQERDDFGRAAQRAQDAETAYLANPGPLLLDRALSAWDDAIMHPVFRRAPSSSRGALLHHAGNLRFRRVQATPLVPETGLGQRFDLDASIAQNMAAMSLLGPDVHEIVRNNLILSLGERYERQRRLGDLDELVKLLREEVVEGGPASLYRSKVDLAHRLWQRYGDRRSIIDLDEAVEQLRSAIGPVPFADAPNVSAEFLLMLCLIERWAEAHDNTDLEAALSMTEPARSHATSAEDWNTIASALSHGYLHDEAADQLDAAIEALRQGALLADSALSRALIAGNLGSALQQRWHLAKRPSDLDDAVAAHRDSLAGNQEFDSYASRAVGAPPSPQVAGALSLLARALRTRAGTSPDSQRAADDLAEADALLAKIARHVKDADPSSRFFVALNWARDEMEQLRWAEAARAYALARQALTEAFRMQIGRRYREARLDRVGSVAIESAVALARAGDERQAALAFDQGRALQLSEALQSSRAQLDEVTRSGRADLVERYHAAVQAMEALSAAPSGGQVPPAAPAL